MQAQPEGSWLWVLDSDIVLMDMQNGLERLISIAEHKKAEFMVANWDCGDGFNMGSIMILFGTLCASVLGVIGLRIWIPAVGAYVSAVESMMSVRRTSPLTAASPPPALCDTPV